MTKQFPATEWVWRDGELFLTGTAAEITPVRSVDRIPIGQEGAGPVTRLLQHRLLGVARGRAADPYGWRHPVTRRHAELGR